MNATFDITREDTGREVNKTSRSSPGGTSAAARPPADGAQVDQQIYVLFGCQHCADVYRATQRRRGDEPNGYFVCRSCGIIVVEWSGDYVLADWVRVSEANRFGLRNQFPRAGKRRSGCKHRQRVPKRRSPIQGWMNRSVFGMASTPDAIEVRMQYLKDELERLLAEASNASRISETATDSKRRAVFSELASHLNVLASVIEKQIAERTRNGAASVSSAPPKENPEH
ncbi:MAG: hypothetical protein PS018_09625 [bacterium]|nr:hypothetical protein [bacterium]